MALPLLGMGLGLIGKLLGGGAKGAADERQNQNNAQAVQNQQALSQYGTQQSALLQALLAKGRDAQDQYQTRQGATTSALGQQSQEGTSRYNTRQGATTTALGQQSNENMQRAQLGLQAPSVRARQSVMGSLMQNLQPVSVEAQGQVRGRVPKITGGLTPEVLSPETRQHGAELSKAALMAQLSGSDVPAATNFMGGVLDAPPSTDFASGVLSAPEPTDYTKGIIAPPKLGGFKQAGRGESILSGLSMGSGLLAELLPFLQRNGGGQAVNGPQNNWGLD